jgi:hypothetical protein
VTRRAEFVLPNSFAPLIVQASPSLGFAILAESGLSFLGVGVPPPATSWGAEIAVARTNHSTQENSHCMPVNPLRRKLATGQAVIGPLLQELPSSPELVEFLVAAGFDFVIIDGEHGGVSTEVCRDLVRAA